MMIKSTKQKHTKFLMDSSYVYVVVQCMCAKNGEQMVL
jgi:hypothetical protein